MNSPLLNYRNRVLNPANPINWEHPINRSLVACWMVPPNSSFRGGQALRDLTRGGRSPSDGVLTNGPTWQLSSIRPGGWGGLSFDGTNDQVVFTDVPKLKITGNQISVSAWARLDTLFSGNRQIVYKAGASARYALLKSGSASNRFLFATTTSSLVELSGTDYITTAGVWHHACGTYDGANMRLYVNGVLNAGPTAQTGNIADTSNPMVIGSTSASEYWQGALDDIRIWTRALSAEEIRAIYLESRQGYPNILQWISNRVFFNPQQAPASPGVFNAAWLTATNKNIGICRAA